MAAQEGEQPMYSKLWECFCEAQQPVKKWIENHPIPGGVSITLILTPA